MIRMKDSGWGKEVNLVYSVDQHEWIAISRDDEWLGNGTTPTEALETAAKYLEGENKKQAAR